MDNLSFEKFKINKNYLLIKKEKKSLQNYLNDKNNQYMKGIFNQNKKKNIIRTKLIDYNFKEKTKFEKLYQNNLINHYCDRDIKKTIGYSQSYLHNLTDLLSNSNNNDNFIEERINLLSLKIPLKNRKKNKKVENELFNHKKLYLTGNDRYFYNKSNNKNFKTIKNMNVSENNKYKYLSLFDLNEYLQEDDLKQPIDDDEEDKEKIETKHIIHLKDYYNFFDPEKKSFANKFSLKKLNLVNKNKINLMRKLNPGAKEFIKGIINKRNKNESSVYYDIKYKNIFPIIKNNMSIDNK